MMNKRLVFISLPMSGIPDKVVEANIERAQEAYLGITKLSRDQVTFINTMDNPDPPEEVTKDKIGVWYLGHSLIHLSKCDEAFFWLGWHNARGCIIERNVCDLYKIPVITVEQEVFYNGQSTPV